MKFAKPYFAFIVLVGALAWGQNDATLSGTVADSTGAVIPQAAVKLTSREQGTVRTAETNQSGVYQFSFLLPGSYNIEISANGFKTTTRTNLVLAAAQNARFDFTLEVGSVTENVVVSAQSEAVEKESAQLGSVIDNTRVVEMPLNSRIFWQLPLLSPNVMPPAQNSGLGYRGGFNVAGSCEGCNTFNLNGMDDNDNTKAIPGFRPSIDAIQEFNVLTGVYPAQYGYASGGQIVMTTKSGTNQFHGTAFDFLRNQAVWSARNFFQVGPAPAFKRNQFGGTLGGPIKKDKTFFFYSYEGLRTSQGVIALSTIPTAAEDAGNFSAIPKTIIDPTTGTPFSGNIIPATRINPVARALLGLLPAPTSPTPAGQAPVNNYNFNQTRTENMNEDSLKLDHVFSAKDSVFATANYYNDPSHEPQVNSCGSEDIPGFGCTLGLKEQLYGLGETHIFSPSMVNEARMGFTMTTQPAIGFSASVPFWSQFGISPYISSISSLPNLGSPSLAVTGYTTFGGQDAFRRADPHWQWADTLSWTLGKHTIKTGMSLNHFASNNANTGNANGTLAFTNSSSGPTSGYGLADLLLGLPQSTTNQIYANKLYLRDLNAGAFIQDDYKVNSRLTLNIGLRWEINTPPVDYGGHEVTFNATTGVPEIQGNTPYLIYQPAGLGDHVLHFDWHDYGPRFGFAWQPFRDGKTVVRGGGGTFFNNTSFYNGLSPIYAAYPINYTYTSSLAQPLSLSNPFPSSNAVASSNVAGADPNFINSRVYEWSLGVERQITNDMLFDVNYFGTSGNHLNMPQNINQPAPGPGTPAQVNARRPYPEWGTVNYIEWDGNSHFESLAVKLQKRFGHGLTFLISYTFSKSIDDDGASGQCNCGAGPTNAYNFQTARGLSAFDVPQRFVASPVYELPFGKGKPFVTQGVMSQIIGGWQISSLIQIQSGTPLTATLSGNFSNSGGTTDRPNLICNPNANAPHTPSEWFNTSCFQVPIASGQPGAPYSFGNEGKGVVFGPSFTNVDLSLVKMVDIRERAKLQIRIEMYDAFNHPIFNNPAVVANVPGFGSITSTIATGTPNRQSQFALKLVF
jgi:hypothetical protein